MSDNDNVDWQKSIEKIADEDWTELGYEEELDEGLDREYGAVLREDYGDRPDKPDLDFLDRVLQTRITCLQLAIQWHQGNDTTMIVPVDVAQTAEVFENYVVQDVLEYENDDNVTNLTPAVEDNSLTD